MVKHFRIAGILRTKLEEAGVSVSAVLRRAGLPQDLFDQTRILVSTAELFALWRAIGSVSNDPAIGLKLGTETRTERFHPSGIAALSTESLGAAVQHLARYKQLTCPEELLHAPEGDEWPLRFRYLLTAEGEPHTLIEYAFAWLLTLARHGAGTRISPLRVEFVETRAHLKALERHFGCPVITGASHNAIIFRASDAALPLTTRNVELLDMLAPHFEEQPKQLKQITQANSITELVRGAIQQRLTGHRPNVHDIARDLHMSSRTLQRRLQDSGSPFQRLLDEARHRMARCYLSNSVLELNEAAYLLGYEDANSFARAFRAWKASLPNTGATPSASPPDQPQTLGVPQCKPAHSARISSSPPSASAAWA